MWERICDAVEHAVTVELASVDLRLPMATVYEDVALQAPVKLPGNRPI